MRGRVFIAAVLLALQVYFATLPGGGASQWLVLVCALHLSAALAVLWWVRPVEPDHPDADLAVLFTHNEGFSTMCGHATIALGRWAVEEGLVPIPPAGPDGVARAPVCRPSSGR